MRVRVHLTPLVARELLTVERYRGWLTDDDDFVHCCGEPPWRMDALFRSFAAATAC